MYFVSFEMITTSINATLITNVIPSCWSSQIVFCDIWGLHCINDVDFTLERIMLIVVCKNIVSTNSIRNWPRLYAKELASWPSFETLNQYNACITSIWSFAPVFRCMCCYNYNDISLTRYEKVVCDYVASVPPTNYFVHNESQNIVSVTLPIRICNVLIVGMLCYPEAAVPWRWPEIRIGRRIWVSSSLEV